MNQTRQQCDINLIQHLLAFAGICFEHSTGNVKGDQLAYEV